MQLFLDTIVLIDVIARRAEFYAASAAVWTRAEGEGNVGWISAISFNNVFYITRKATGLEAAKEAVRVLRDTFEVVSLDPEVLDAALSSGISDFEDAIQYCSALRPRAHYLVTRNVRDFPQSGVTVISPEELLALLGAADAGS